MSAAPSLPPLPKLDIRATFGALLIGTFLSSILYGLTTHQTYRYYRLYPQDRIWFKIFVATLWILDTVHTVLSMHFCYFYLVVNYFNPLELQNGTRTLQISLLVGIIVAFLTNSFYAWRLHIIGERNIILTGVMVSLTIVRFGFGLASVIESMIQLSFVAFEKFSWLIQIVFAIAVATDLAMALAITFCLHQKKTGHERTNSIVDILMMYTINTGLVTSCVTITSLIFTIVAPDNLMYLLFHLLLGKCYVNSVLAVLNSRKSLQDHGAECFDRGAFGLQGPALEISLPTDQHHQKVNKKSYKNSKSPVIDITITHTEEVGKDKPWNIPKTRSIQDSL